MHILIVCLVSRMGVIFTVCRCVISVAPMRLKGNKISNLQSWKHGPLPREMWAVSPAPAGLLLVFMTSPLLGLGRSEVLRIFRHYTGRLKVKDITPSIAWIAIDRHRSSKRHRRSHIPSLAFRHLPPNSARFSYATEGALFISEQLSTDAVSALRKVWVLIWL